MDAWGGIGLCNQDDPHTQHTSLEEQGKIISLTRIWHVCPPSPLTPPPITPAAPDPDQLLNIPANTRHWHNVVSMLGQRRRRWSSIETTFGQWIKSYSQGDGWVRCQCITTPLTPNVGTMLAWCLLRWPNSGTTSANYWDPFSICDHGKLDAELVCCL